MADIFISFIHEEVDVADGVRDFLGKKLADNTKVFLSADKWTVLAGEDWLKRVKNELTSARIVVLILSEDSVKRPWVNFGAGAGWISEDKILIPTCFGGLHKGAMPKPYSDLDGVSLEDHSDLYYLVTSIYQYLQPRMIAPPPFGPTDPAVVELLRIVKAFEEKTKTAN